MSDTRQRYVQVALQVRQLLDVRVESYRFKLKRDAKVVEAEVMVAAV